MSEATVDGDHVSLVDLLGERPEFAGVPREVLHRIAEHARLLDVPAGNLLLEEGSPPDAMYVAVEGEFEVTRRVEDRELPVGRLGRGDILGEMALLEERPRSASARALVDSRVAEIDRDAFAELLGYAPFVLAMLKTVSNRNRHSEVRLREAEKLAALGTMTAGLMHELNNPAAAVRRDAPRLAGALAHWRELAGQMAGLETVTPPSPASRLPADGLARADREDEVGAWLDEQGVAEAWDLAPVLVARGWDAAALADLAALGPGHAPADLARWFGLEALADELSTSIHRSAERISELVAAVKRYARKDEAPVQNVDVHESLEDTLIILRPEHAGVRVERDYASGLPRIEAYGSELNQVWTNLVGNAVDAMDGDGTLTLRTYRDNDRVVVEVVDSGPGIPPEVLPRIFEPYFTTKPPGQGTGLGLHVAYDIVARHGGDLRVDSRPGETAFRVFLPFRLPTNRSGSRSSS
ncbi:MAG: ATP-binding protein [Actinomycetota bacterium]|nr:ATP-binding protein [Actinomycetota bacterium]